jgi:leucyl aminopeptidase
MEFQAVDTAYLAWSGAGLALGLCEEQVDLGGDLAELDQRLGGALAELIAEAEFKGKSGSSAATRIGGEIRKLIIVGLGAAESLEPATLREAAGTAAKLARQQKCETLAVSFPLAWSDPAASAGAIAEGIELALYRDQRFKSEDAGFGGPDRVELLRCMGGESLVAEAVTKAIAQSQHVCAGVFLARELVAAPANVVTPISLAATAEALAKTYGLDLEILEREDCEKLGMGAFLGVAQASEMPPKFIHLTYRPEGTPRKKVAIVGKGLTFDSGGLNIKAGAGSSIEMMKTDMGGAGATFGAAKAIAAIKPDVEVHFISAATENMVSGRAMHPGDILTASNGKTIEVNNTDAEGRLTLADALVFAEKLGVEAIVDLATLTGACVVALGNDIAGLWSSSPELSAELLSAAENAGEKLWEMPLEEKYFESMKSVVADMKNTGVRAGGAISAAAFLKQFVQDTPWAHLDVAGPVWSEKESALSAAGATGYGVRLLVQWVLGGTPA